MAYYYGEQVLVDANSLITQIEGHLTAASDVGGPYPGLWTFVEQFSFTRSSVNYNARVWQCSGLVNAYGWDFYVLLGWRTSAAADTLFFSASEGFDSGTKRLPYPIPNSTTTTAVSAADGGFNPTGPLMSDVSSSTSAAWTGIASLSPNSATDWYVSITPGHLAIAINQSGTVRGALFVGGHAPFPGYTQTQMPTLFGGILGTTFVASRSGFAQSVGIGGQYNAVPTAQQRPAGNLSSGGLTLDRFTGAIQGSPVVLGGHDYVISSAAGGVSQLMRCPTPLPSILTFQETSSIPRNGDRITIGGTTYARFGASSGSGSSVAISSIWIDENA